MAKIYNEVVIDMNPESPTFEETIYEDSYEYEGDMMLAYNDYYIDTDMDGKYDTVIAFDGNNEIVRDSGGARSTLQTINSTNESAMNDQIKAIAESLVASNPDYKIGASLSGASMGGTVAKSHGEEGGGEGETDTTYGKESLKKSDFFDALGNPLPQSQIEALIKQHKPNATDAEIKTQVEEFMPKLQGVSKEEKGFLETEKGLAGQERDLGMTKAKDAYGLSTSAAKRGLGTAMGQAQQQASSLGGQMRGAYGGGSMGMRGAIGGQQTLAKGVESTYGAYGDKMLGAEQALGYAETAGGIGEQRADLAYDKGMYGLEQGQTGEFEGDISGWLKGFKQGGRVPSKQTFLDVLSKIPDAGGS